MLWEEDEQAEHLVVNDEIIDLSFALECKTLPLDHAYDLSHAIQQALPWFAPSPTAGLHLIHGAESGNGWQRPENPDGTLYLSRRTRLTLRLSSLEIEKAQGLCGQILDIAGHPLKIGTTSQKPLQKTNILFARHILCDAQHSEEDFLHTALKHLERLNIQCRKAMPGRSHQIKTPQQDLFTRSLMLADLSIEDALLLQQQGLGEGRKMGCGLFIPHKGISPVDQK